jgi:hypothetical protein
MGVLECLLSMYASTIQRAHRSSNLPMPNNSILSMITSISEGARSTFTVYQKTTLLLSPTASVSSEGYPSRETYQKFCILRIVQLGLAWFFFDDEVWNVVWQKLLRDVSGKWRGTVADVCTERFGFALAVFFCGLSVVVCGQPPNDN